MKGHLRSLIAIAVSAPMLAIAAPLVHAAPGAEMLDSSVAPDCSPGNYCLYDFRGFNHNNTGAAMWVVSTPIKTFGQMGAEDRAGSLVNNTDHPVHFFQDYGDTGGGICLEVPPHRAVYDLTFYGLSDQISSAWFSEHKCY